MSRAPEVKSETVSAFRIAAALEATGRGCADCEVVAAREHFPPQQLTSRIDSEFSADASWHL